MSENSHYIVLSNKDDNFISSTMSKNDKSTNNFYYFTLSNNRKITSKRGLSKIFNYVLSCNNIKSVSRNNSSDNLHYSESSDNNKGT